MIENNKNKYLKHQKLIKACKKGNKKAQFEIYKLYYSAMYSTCIRIVKDPVEAEDIMQEAFLKAFNKIDSYKAEVSFGAWLKKIVVNNALDFLKKRKLELSEINENITVFEDDDDTLNDDKETIELIKNKILELPDGYRVILSLYLLEGYDHDEIANILDITSSTSRSQYSRAKKRLLQEIQNAKLTY
ncbi:MAG: RNA polymerase sigma factor [Bacteroidales bacterium]|jgi:RNA polymerase sigma-70 factor (ECF subfamily)|nr:RNA polymerase sigma factor [Bacteroidales bacterium]